MAVLCNVPTVQISCLMDSLADVDSVNESVISFAIYVTDLDLASSGVISEPPSHLNEACNGQLWIVPTLWTAVPIWCVKP